MKLRHVLPLIIGFIFVPAALMLTVGILILVYGSVARDYVFGILIVSLVSTTIIGHARPPWPSSTARRGSRSSRPTS